MEKRVHRYAPRSPLVRVLLALVGVVVALLTTVIGLHWLVRMVYGGYGLFSWGWLTVPGVLGLVAVYYLARGVADQAAAAPAEANPARGRHRDGADAADPVRVLQERYARGEVDDEQFESRMERLLESDARTSERGGRGDGRPTRGEPAGARRDGPRVTVAGGDGYYRRGRTGRPVGMRFRWGRFRPANHQRSGGCSPWSSRYCFPSATPESWTVPRPFSRSGTSRAETIASIACFTSPRSWVANHPAMVWGW